MSSPVRLRDSNLFAMLLDRQSGALVIVPVTTLSHVERQSMRHFVQLHIAPAPAATGSLT